jgi:hypothetical protein
MYHAEALHMHACMNKSAAIIFIQHKCRQGPKYLDQEHIIFYLIKLEQKIESKIH